MSDTPSSSSHPSHGFPTKSQAESVPPDAKSATGAHPPRAKPDPTLTESATSSSAAAATAQDGTQGRLTTASASSSSELANLKVKLRNGLRTFPDFPQKGILFEDIMPLFSSPTLHESLARALELQVAQFPSVTQSIDVVVGLESRGFLFGPTLAMRLGAGFVPVRKQGKLPGKCVSATYQKEYGKDVFEMQEDAIKSGQKVLIVDDIIATGGSAAAAGDLVQQLGGDLQGYLFIMELDFLKGRDKLNKPVVTLLSGQEKALDS